MIEQREDGSLFSLSYGRATPPIDGNALTISIPNPNPNPSPSPSPSPKLNPDPNPNPNPSQATPSSSRLSISLHLPMSPYVSLCLPHHLDSISLYLPGNALIISTLDRVSEHPFVRQAAWDLSHPLTLALTLSRHPTLTPTLARPRGTSSSSTSASPCRLG